MKKFSECLWDLVALTAEKAEFSSQIAHTEDAQDQLAMEIGMAAMKQLTAFAKVYAIFGPPNRGTASFNEVNLILALKVLEEATFETMYQVAVEQAKEIIKYEPIP